MIKYLKTDNKYIILIFITFNCMIVINANPLNIDTAETPSNEDKLADPEELVPNVDDISKTAAISPNPESTDDEARSIKVDVINEDSVTSEIIARTDFAPSEEVKEKRSTDIDMMSFMDDSDFRSDLDDSDLVDAGPVSRIDTVDKVAKSADDSVNQDQGSDTESTVRSEQGIDESKAATEIDDSNVERADTENNERVSPSEESSDNVRTEGRDAEETVELDSPTDGFIRGSRRMESGEILETKGRSGENVDITRTVPTPDLRSLNALNPLGTRTSTRSFKNDLIVPHVHTILNSPSILYPNMYGISSVPNMLNRVASAEINPVSRSFPFYPDNGPYSLSHTHAHASAESNSKQLKSMDEANTYPYISTQNPLDPQQIIPNNFNIMKKLTDASSMPIKPTIFNAESVRPFSNLFNTANQGFLPKNNQFSAPRIRRSIKEQPRIQENLNL